MSQSYKIKVGETYNRQKQIDLGLLAIERDQNYCRVPTWGFHSRSRIPVGVYEGLEQMETMTKYFSITLWGTPDIDLIPFRVFYQLPCYISWNTKKRMFFNLSA